MGAYLCAMLLFGTLGLFVRQAHVAGDVLAFLRTLIGAAFLGVLLLLQRHRLPLSGVGFLCLYKSTSRPVCADVYIACKILIMSTPCCGTNMGSTPFCRTS